MAMVIGAFRSWQSTSQQPAILEYSKAASMGMVKSRPINRNKVVVCTVQVRSLVEASSLQVRWRAQKTRAFWGEASVDTLCWVDKDVKRRKAKDLMCCYRGLDRQMIKWWLVCGLLPSACLLGDVGSSLAVPWALHFLACMVWCNNLACQYMIVHDDMLGNVDISDLTIWKGPGAKNIMLRLVVLGLR